MASWEIPWRFKAGKISELYKGDLPGFAPHGDGQPLP